MPTRTGDIPSSISMDMTLSAHVTSMTVQTNNDKVFSVNSNNVGSSCKLLTNGDCLMAQAKNMIAMPKVVEGFNETRKNLLPARHRISSAKAISADL